MIRRMRHLVRRFYEVLTARPLSPAEQAEAAALLRPSEAAAFWGLAHADQRHCIAAARAVAAAHPDRIDLIRAALLHDVGKRHAPLAVPLRIIASLLETAGLSGRGRIGRYLQHGPLGAEDLEAAGCEPIVVAFARDHHGGPPAGIDPLDWAILTEADGE